MPVQAYVVSDKGVPMEVYSNQELREIVKNEIKRQQEYKKQKREEEKNVISAKTFLNSKLVNRTCI